MDGDVKVMDGDVKAVELDGKWDWEDEQTRRCA